MEQSAKRYQDGAVTRHDFTSIFNQFAVFLMREWPQHKGGHKIDYTRYERELAVVHRRLDRLESICLGQFGTLDAVPAPSPE